MVAQEPEPLVSKLRTANENLVIASLLARDLQDRAEASNLRQNEFLAMLAHELRNPLAPIGLAAEMLGNLTSSHPEIPQIQELLVRQVSHMNRLLEDLLDASRVRTGKITLRSSPLLLAEIVEHAVEIARPSLLAHGQTLSIDLPQESVMVNGDPVRMSQVFSNLLLNASKYSRQTDTIALSARVRSNGLVAVSVKDKGVGIDPALQPFIFDLFTQATGTLDRSEGGLGIGLSMVRALVELHGGTVQVISEGLGRGSEFIVVLPTSNVAASALIVPALPRKAERPCRILLVEDSRDSNETLAYCLRWEGHTVSSAFDGPSGLAMAASGAYELVICDIGLPGMDGYQVIRQLKARDLKPVPVCIALSGYGQDEFRHRAARAGFDHYLVKPASLSAVRALIMQAFPVAAK